MQSPPFFMQKYAKNWPEGGAATNYSMFIGQKCHQVARKIADGMRNVTFQKYLHQRIRLEWASYLL